MVRERGCDLRARSGQREITNLGANRGALPRLMNVVRAISSEGFGRMRYYREIRRLTGVSVTTIGRVARYLANGNGGYRAALDALNAAARRRETRHG